MQKVFTLVILLSLCFISDAARCQQTDSVVLSLDDAETIFLRENLTLLATHYNIDINKAWKQQASYLDNPILNTDQNIYDGKFFRHTTVNGQEYGEIFVQLQQLIRTAGKRNKLIRLADDGVLTATEQFNDVLRNLRLVFHTDFYTLLKLQRADSIYAKETAALKRLADGMDAQLQAGNISQKENIRVKALLYDLQTDQADNQLQMSDVQKELHVLLGLGRDTVLIAKASDTTIARDYPSLSIATLVDSALNNRPDVKLAAINTLTQQHTLAYQKALAVPDVTAGVEYDHLNSYVPHYYGLFISLPLPVFNRNKGNITASRLQVQQATIQEQQVKKQLEQEVMAAYNKVVIATKLNGTAAPDLETKYDILLKNMTESYGQRQVSLVEFIDFFEAYKETRLKEYQQQLNLRNAIEELRFSVGIPML